MDVAKGDRGDIVAEEIGKIRALRWGRHKRKRGRDHALHAGNGRRQHTHLMPAATGRGVIIVAEMKPDIVQHVNRNTLWRCCCRGYRSRWRDRPAPPPTSPMAP